MKLLKSQDHEQVLLLKLIKVELLIKKHSLSPSEMLEYPIQIAEKAYVLSRKVYGDKALVTNQIMLNYAVALTQIEKTQEQGIYILEQSLKQYSIINNEIHFKEDCDLLFNMLLHYQLMLSQCGIDVSEIRKKLMSSLK